MSADLERERERADIAVLINKYGAVQFIERTGVRCEGRAGVVSDCHKDNSIMLRNTKNRIFLSICISVVLSLILLLAEKLPLENYAKKLLKVVSFLFQD